MMEFFRGRLFKRFIMWFMAVVFAVMFGMVVAGLDPSTLFTGGTQWALRVDGVKIGTQEYQKALQRETESAQDLLRYGQDIDVSQRTESALIQRALMVSYAHEHSIVPAVKEVQRAVSKNADLANEFRPYGIVFSSAQAIEAFAQDQAIQAVRRLVEGLPVVSSAEIEQDFLERNTKAKLRFLEFQYLQFESNVEVSEDEARSFYDANGGIFWRGAAVDVDFIKLDPNLARSAVTVSDDDVRSYYEQRLSNYESEEVHARHILRRLDAGATAEEQQAAREKAQEILELARESDADFEALAIEHSDDTASAVGGGDLGWFARGQMVPPFENAAFGLSKDNPLSGLVRSQFGYHIIQYLDRRSTATPLSQVRSDIEATLSTARSVERTREDAEEFFFEIDAEGVEQTLEQERFQVYELKVERTGVFTAQDTTIPNLGPSYLYEDVREKAFRTRSGEWSEPIEVKQTYDNKVTGYVLLRIRDRRPAGIAPFEDVRSDVERLLKQKRAPELAMSAAERLWAKYKDGDDVDTLAEKYVPTSDDPQTLHPKDSGEFATQSAGYISGMGFCKPAMVAAFQMDLNEVRGVFKGQRAAYIVRLAERTDADLLALTDAEKANIRIRLLDREKRAVLSAWYQDIRDAAEIERNAAVLSRF